MPPVRTRREIYEEIDSDLRKADELVDGVVTEMYDRATQVFNRAGGRMTQSETNDRTKFERSLEQVQEHLSTAIEVLEQYEPEREAGEEADAVAVRRGNEN